MATGLTIVDDDISVGGRVSPGAQLSRVKTYLFTESTDLTVNVAIASGGVNFGSSQVITIPTKGMIVLRFAGDLTGVTTTFSPSFGLNDGTSDFFPQKVNNGATEYTVLSGPSAGTTDVIYGGAGGNSNVPPAWFLPIEELAIGTGSKTIQIIVADDGDTNSHTIDGSTGTISPAQVYMEVWDYS